MDSYMGFGSSNEIVHCIRIDEVIITEEKEMFRDKDLARIGYDGDNELYVVFPQKEGRGRIHHGGLEAAKSLLRKTLIKELESGDREELEVEKEIIQEEIKKYSSMLVAYKKDLENIEEEINRGLVGEKEAEWLDVLIKDMIRKISPDYVHPYNTKLGYRPTEIAISEWYDRDESGVKGDSILDFGISVHWGKIGMN